MFGQLFRVYPRPDTPERLNSTELLSPSETISTSLSRFTLFLVNIWLMNSPQADTRALEQTPTDIGLPTP